MQRASLSRISRHGASAHERRIRFGALIILVIFMLAFTALLTAQEGEPDVPSPVIPAQGKILGDFIPPDWKGIDTVSGDLNADGVQDHVLVIEHIAPTDRTTQPDDPRILLVLFGDRSGALSLSCRADSLVLRANEGGVMGDPFLPHLGSGAIAIQHGCILLHMDGGSSEKWNLDYRFRYQNAGWYLIGATTGGGNASHLYQYDYNLITGIFISRIEDHEHPKRNGRWMEKLPIHPLRRMETFIPWSITVKSKKLKEEIYL